MKLIKSIAVLFCLGLAGQASADAISALNDPGSSVDFSWHVNDKGFLVIRVQNNSGTGVVSGILFDMGAGSIDHMVDVDGTGGNRMWRQIIDGSGACSTSICVAGRGGRNAVQPGGVAEFRFTGDFTGLDSISGVMVGFRNTGENGNTRDWGYGCGEGCGAYRVPEPGMLVLFGTGLLGVGVAWRRRQKAIA